MEDIGDYMTSPVLSVDSEVTVQEAAHYMHAHKIGAVFVKNGGEFVGKMVEVTVTNSLQTSAGRMIFATVLKE